MAQPIGTTGRMARFAELYIRYANATRAAIEAGYSVKAAAQEGSRLLRNVKVRSLIDAKLINKQVHAQATYANMIELADMAMAFAKRKDLVEEEKLKAIEIAGRQLERLARFEGIILPPMRQDDSQQRVTLQQIIQVMTKNATINLTAPAESKIIDLPPSNGSANGNGTTHH